MAQGPTKKDKNWYLVEVATEKKAVLSLEEAPFKLYVYEGKSCIMSTADADSGIYCADLFPKGSKPKPPGSESKQKLAKANPKPMDSGKASKTHPPPQEAPGRSVKLKGMVPTRGRILGLGSDMQLRSLSLKKLFHLNLNLFAISPIAGSITFYHPILYPVQVHLQLGARRAQTSRWKQVGFQRGRMSL